MIRRIRSKFIRIAMAALSVAMVLVTVVINGANWYYAWQEMSDTASYISENGGHYPSENGMRYGKGRRLSGEASYETRYFSVLCSGDDEYEALNMESIASVDEEEAIELARQAVSTGRASGFLGNYLFNIYEKGGGTVIAFVDCETRLDSLRGLGVISAVACLAGILLSLLIVALLSRRAIQPLIESAEKQKRFITDAGHELKTPLTVISANMDVLSMDIGKNEWIESTQKQLTNMRKLVGDLVTLAKTDEEETPAQAQKFDLSAAVSDTADSLGAMAEFHGKRLTQNVAPGLAMTGDEGAIRRLVSILVDNAVKYAAEGDEILLSLSAEGRRARLSTLNTPAAPVEKEQLERLFDRFYRADPSRSKESGRSGYGLGLAIARATVEKHGGRIFARMEGERIEFVCLLPLSGK